MYSEQNSTVAGFSTVPVSAVAVKIPTLFFWNDLALWFSWTEVQFTLKDITSQVTELHCFVASMEPQTALHVRALILNSPATDPYNAVKNFLLQSFSPSEHSRLKRLSNTNSIADMKLNELLLFLQRLLDDSAFDKCLLKSLFLTRLPISIRTSSAAMPDKSSICWFKLLELSWIILHM